MLAIGDSAKAERLMAILSTDHHEGRLQLVAVVPLDELDRLADAIQTEQPDRVVLLKPDCPGEALDKILAAARTMPVRLQVLGEHLGDDAVAMLPSERSDGLRRAIPAPGRLPCEEALRRRRRSRACSSSPFPSSSW